MDARTLQLAAIVIITALLATVAGMLHVGQVQRGIFGPMALALHGNQLAVALPGEIWLLDAAGNSRLRLDSRSAGLLEPLSDIEFLDAQTLLVAGDTGAPLLACTLPALQCSAFGGDRQTAPRGPLVLLATPDQVWASESDAHRVHLFDHAGIAYETPLDDSPDDRTLQFFRDRVVGNDVDSVPEIDGIVYPHGLAARGDTLLLANAGRQEILVRHRVDGSAEGVLASALSRLNDAGYRYPLQLAADAGDGWWAVVADMRYTRSTLLHLDAGGHGREVLLPAAVNPRALQALGQDLLVADLEAIRLWRVGMDGMATAFGDAALQAQLALLRDKRVAAARHYLYLQVVLGVLLVAVVAIAVLDRRRRDAGSAPLPVEREPVPARVLAAGLGLPVIAVLVLLAQVAAMALSQDAAVRIIVGLLVVLALAYAWYRQRA